MATATPEYKRGIVKEVPSGDQLVIMGMKWDTGLPPTKTICLSGIDGPRIGYRDRKDEPFAFQAREFLRKKCIGKVVAFKVEYTIPGGTREFGSVFLGKENLVESVVEAGWAKLRPQKGDFPGDETLTALAEAAETAGLGVWTEEPGAAAASIRDVSDGVEDALRVKDLAAGQELPATVEYIFDAARLRLLLGPPYHMVAFNLSGMQAPPIRRQADGTEEAAPFAKEAKFFTERSVLNRDVKVILEGTDKYNNFFGSLFYEDENGDTVNLGLQLATQGMAKCVEWSMKFATMSEGLRAAEKAAKEQRLRIWRDWVPPVRAPSSTTALTGSEEYYARLIEVRSGDTLVLLNLDDDSEDNIILSSIRSPRLGNARRNVKNEPFSWEARELLRKHVGKKCLVSLEYARKVVPMDGGPERVLTCASVFVEDRRNKTFTKNLAVLLVDKGYATVQQHREDDERSQYYDELLVAESVAEKGNKGLHNAKKAETAAIMQKDVSSSDGKQSQALLPSYKRAGKMTAIVEYCYNGARFKLYIPKQNCFVNFALSLVAVPGTARKEGDKDEPYGQLVSRRAKANLFQRDVTIEIETADRGGTFIGTLYDEKGNDYAQKLVQEGLAYVRSSRFASEELLAMEATAKEAKLKIWENYVEAEDEVVTTPEEEFLEATVVEIAAAGHFYLHRTADQGKLEQITGELAELDLDTKSAPGSKPPRGTLCCAKWCGDWYRAKVTGSSGDDIRVIFVDYGNTDVVALDTLRPITDELKRTEAIAIECRLAGLKCPAAEDEYFTMAGQFFKHLTWGKQLVAKVEYRERGVTHVTLFDQSKDAEVMTVSAAMLREGLARLGSLPVEVALPELMSTHQKDEDLGKRSRMNMWRYGDCYDDDEAPEFGYKK